MVNFINDNYMTYDLELHMYKLEPDSVNDIIEGADEELTECELSNILIMIRNDFYSECLDYAVYRDKYLHYLSIPDNRAYIKEAQKMMFQDLIINRSTPGLAYSNKDVSLVTPRTRKYMKTMKLILIQHLYDTPLWYNQKDLKGTEW